MTNLAEVQGAWRRGWTLDLHTISSEFLGYDQQGREQFDTKRSPLGELVYQLKYRGHTQSADQIAAAMATFFDARPGELSRIDVIVPMPPSHVRPVQPVVKIAQVLAQKLGRPMLSDAVRKTCETPELKNIQDPEQRRELLDGAFEADSATLGGKGVLLIDDLYRSGATANAVTLAMIRAGTSRVYFLAATRTRSRA